MSTAAAEKKAVVEAAASDGAIAFVAYRKRIREGFEGNPAAVLGDLLCDLRHFADANGLDWEEAISYANRHYQVEVYDAN